MSAVYTVRLLDGGVLAGRHRIELEVQLARELERALGGQEEVAGAYGAALMANHAGAAAQCWEMEFRRAVQVVRADAQLPVLDFEVNLIGGHRGGQ